jgi:hypothetical protein
MTLHRTVAEVLSDHALFRIECMDRAYLNVYQPRLQHAAGIAAFFAGHRGSRLASSALMGPVTGAFVADLGHFIAARGLDLYRFGKGGARTTSLSGGCARRPWTSGAWSLSRSCISGRPGRR